MAETQKNSLKYVESKDGQRARLSERDESGKGRLSFGKLNGQIRSTDELKFRDSGHKTDVDDQKNCQEYREVEFVAEKLLDDIFDACKGMLRDRRFWGLQTMSLNLLLKNVASLWLLLKKFVSYSGLFDFFLYLQVILDFDLHRDCQK